MRIITVMASHHVKKSRRTLFFILNIPILLCFCVHVVHAETLHEDAETALKSVRTWVNDNLTVSKEKKLLADHISGVCVILSRNGTLLGYGEAFGDEPTLLSEAASLAFNKVRKNPIILKLPESVREHALSLIGIEVGIAGKRTPIPTKNLDKAAKKILRGVDSIAVRRGKNWDVRLPSLMRLSPFRRTVNHLEGMCIKVGAPAADALSHQLSNREDITIYKVHFASAYQHASRENIQLLYRGDEVISTNQLLQTGLHAVADLLASYLVHSQWPGEEAIGITGTYKPEVDRLDDVFAPIISQAMAAEALWQYTKIPRCLYRQEATAVYIRIMNDLAIVNENESPITGVLDQSFVVLASNDEVVLSDEAIAMITDCKSDVVTAAAQLVDGSLVPKKPLERGVLSAAVAHIASQDVTVLPLAEKVISACFTTTNEDDRASLIPWIVQASVRVSNMGFKVDVEDIQQLLDNALASQVVDDSIPDLLGGFSLNTMSGSVVDARSIRMLPMLAALLPTDEFTPHGERLALLQSMLLAARFTSQLTTTPERASRFANPERAVGGVRNSPWDATMKPEAVAMALIGISDAIKAINSVAMEH